jgi:hypothetical protein
MNRVNKILVGLVVVQLALAIVMLTRDDKVRIAPLAPVLVGFDVAQVKRIQVFDKNADKPSIDLARAGADWKLASAFDHPAEGTKVADLLTKLAGLKSRGPLATTAVRHHQLAVADAEFAKKLIVTTAAGDTTILVGNADAGRTTAVRVGASPKVFGVTGLTAWGIETSPARWIDGNYVTLDRAQIQRVLIAGPAGTTELERGASGWQLMTAGMPVALPLGEELDATAVESLIGQVAKLVVFEPGDPKRDASTPTATISVWMKAPDPTAGGAVSADLLPDHVIDLIADADGGNYWVHERNRPTAGRIGKGALSAVLEASRATLVKKPVAPTSPPPAVRKPGHR